MIVTVDEIKAQLRILHDHENDLIEQKILAAEAHVQSHIGQKFADFEDGPPEPLRQAVSVLAAHLYEFREAAGSSLTVTPMGLYDMLAPYRTWKGF